ncbi:hypothetical protein SEA_FIREMAN_8 [Microbacterium phage Fireman]|uniref:Uncharacterized protein n=1 Tax=Microbacterium phage Fireman TaxID=2530118 RepID=A0A481VVT9_9CAUD|nr:hypothetical protein HOV22_gp09 [Microbacterium phage Fireman]QBI98092.1 hypothetical protein SEA_FIREMAN_8 [Microbacterium phage Fireman]
MNHALNALRHHVTGAIERGEAKPIIESPAEPYPGVGALFNADLHTVDPTYAPREHWIVKGPRRIEHLPMEER